jgi:hypothetical protein
MPVIICWHADCYYLRGLTSDPFTTRLFQVTAGKRIQMEILRWTWPMKISYPPNPFAG